MNTPVATRTTYPHIMCHIPDIEYQDLIESYNYRWREKYVFILHSILFQQIRNKQGFNGYVNLDSQLLTKLLGSRYYKFVINQLINSGIIETLKNADGKDVYLAGAFSKAYRIAPKYTNLRVKAIPIHKQTYCRKIALYREQSVKDAIKINPLLQHEFLQLTRRRIDVERAFMYIEQTYKRDSKQFSSRVIALREFDAMKDTTFTQERTNIGFHFSYNKGRVYSPASMLPRDLEQFTYFPDYENEGSVSIDMPNSQLCFFNELVKCEYIGEDVYEEGNKTKKANFQKLKVAKVVPSILLHSPSPYVMTIANWEDYIFNGLGYERMMFLCNWMGKPQGHTKDERQEFKAEFFGQLFYNRYSDVLTNMEQVFMTYHEKEAKALRDAKKRLTNKLLAVQVQKLEGKFFHHILVSHMKRKYKDIPFTIKHDSITLPQSCAGFLIEEFNGLVHDFFNRNDIQLKADLL